MDGGNFVLSIPIMYEVISVIYPLLHFKLKRLIVERKRTFEWERGGGTGAPFLLSIVCVAP